MAKAVIYWFRQDLRLQDLRALAAALASGKEVLPCYILDDDSPQPWRMGGASRWWLHHSLTSLAADVKAAGGQLYLARGRPEVLLPQLAEAASAESVFCSRQYEPWARELEDKVFQALASNDVALKRYSGSLLWEPETVSTLAGTPFKVFTPFWRKCRELDVAPLLPADVHLGRWPRKCGPQDQLGDWQLLPSDPDWAVSWREHWQPGEQAALRKLDSFLAGNVSDYQRGRDFPASNSTSRLSAHLHFGEIAPARVFAAARERGALYPELQAQTDKFLSELGWREFCYHLLFHFPQLPHTAFKPQFETFPWAGNADALRAWQQGRTGYPIVDAGMRELWQTGYMHNRVRMVVASFLCKHLLIDWRAGQRWFWDTLVDADLANNACSWQWVSGSGADAAPYFRIFNPITQGEKFDGEGEYVRQWVPELAALPDRYLHQPWTAPAPVLTAAGLSLPEHYPLPIVDHADARRSALAAYEDVKSVSSEM